jgi:hypothetical protein
MGNAIRRLRRDIERGRRTINANHQVIVEIPICPGCFARGAVSPLGDRDTGACIFAVVTDDSRCSQEDASRRDRVLYGNDGW